MKEATGNLWTYPADVRVITTNGYVKSNGEAVMGRGCALEAAQRIQYIAKSLGECITRHGNHVFFIASFNNASIVTFPVKHHWKEEADMYLIGRSAVELVEMIDAIHSTARVVLPRPGCGNGRLLWHNVRPALENILDDRFTVITFGKDSY